MTSKFFSSATMIMSIVMMVMAWTMSTKDKTLTMEWTLTQAYGTNMKMELMMDPKSSTFAACVLIITSSILTYSKYYMSESIKQSSFTKMIMMFIASMMVLIFSPNMISVILGWEGLGMTSFLLIMFYQNKKSLNSSFYTMMMNRMGDIMMIMSMAKMMSLSSWSLMAMTTSPQTLTLTMLMIGSFSKSAQIPFSSWLTEAMAAPTPISALVHSSTLVTAGILLFIRFEPILKYKKTNTTIFLVSIMTLMMASMNSLTEWDIKKIVALSTLSQLSMMFITISMNMYNLAMFHLLVHATFKALIFLCSSSLISFSNTQDIRKMNKLSQNMFITKTSFNVATLTLCGFPFMSSFYSKEMILEMMIIKNMNLIFVTAFFACMAATLYYSLKTLYFINKTTSKQVMAPKQELMEQKTSKMMLLVPSVIYGNKMNWIINMNFKLPHMNATQKMIPHLMLITLIIMMNEMWKSTTSQKKMKNSKIKMMMNYMWFMKNMSTQIKNMTFKSFKYTFKMTEKKTFNEMIQTLILSTKKMSKKNFMTIHKNSKKMNMIILTTMILMM